MTPGSRYSDPQRGRHATIINATADHVACTLEDARGPMRRLADPRLPAASHVYVLPRAFFVQRYQDTSGPAPIEANVDLERLKQSACSGRHSVDLSNLSREERRKALGL